VLSLINNLDLPNEHDGSGNYFNDNTFTVYQHSKNVEFYPDVKKNAIVLRNRKVSAKARS